MTVQRPSPGEIAEAKRYPNGWIYRISGHANLREHVPPEAIVGAWKVDENGQIVGAFIPNLNHDPVKWPGRSA
jgi:hypothetical protein